MNQWYSTKSPDEKDSWEIRRRTDPFDLDDRAYAAMELSSEGKNDQAEQMLIEILRIDMANLLAMDGLAHLYYTTGRRSEAFRLASTGVLIGLEALPKTFKWGKSQLSYYWLPNRPFIRLLFLRASILATVQGEQESATDSLANLLGSCPNDNLGVRYLLPSLYIKQDRLDEVITLCNRYPDDCSPFLTFARPLALALSNRHAEAAAALAVAAESCPLVLKELRRKRHPKPRGYNGYSYAAGSAEEAFLYWEDYGEFWENPKAKALLSIQ
jgi:hypothetical protein